MGQSIHTATAGLKLGLIGLDTSHVIKFAEILNDSSNPYHIEGASIVAGYPGGSADLQASYSRVEGFTNQLREQFQVPILQSPEEVAEAADALLITSVDGRIHQQQFQAIAKYGKPVFIDKPFTCSSQEAEDIYKTAADHGVALMSCSSLRYLEPLRQALAEDANVLGMDCYTPMALEPANPGWFWYGIHGTEMLTKTLGTGCEYVHAMYNDNFEHTVAVWKDGRIGTVRGTRTGNFQYGAMLHYANRSVHITSAAPQKPMTAIMLEYIIDMFRTGNPDVAPEETLAIIRFIEAVNKSRVVKGHVYI